LHPLQIGYKDIEANPIEGVEILIKYA